MNGNCPKHLRNASLTACSALLLALAGCGGDGPRADAGPRIDAAAAAELSAASEDIARLIDEGEVCTAAHRADELLAAAEAAVQDGSVPQALATQLLDNAEALQNEVNCAPPPPPPPPPPADDGGDDEGNGKGKGKGKDKEDGDD